MIKTIKGYLSIGQNLIIDISNTELLSLRRDDDNAFDIDIKWNDLRYLEFIERNEFFVYDSFHCLLVAILEDSFTDV